MEADTYELKRILQQERRYMIPTFQRDYEWTREEQWELLFEDLKAVAHRLCRARLHADATGTSRLKAERSVAPHFLGAIVCDELPSPAGGVALRAVIDGQQRLTTLQLLLRGLLDVLIEEDSPRVRQVRRLLENPDDVVVKPHEIHKLWPRRRDRDVWPLVMADTPLPAQRRDDHLYLQARRYFAQAIRDNRYDEYDNDRLEHFVDALLDLFKLVVIDLGDNDDAQVIFEVLNGRQTTLSTADLVKNLLFLRGEVADEAHLEQLYDTYWAPFDEPWWKTKVGTGHAARLHRDVLLSVWLTAATGEEASVAHLYGEVRSYLSASDRKTEDVLAELRSYAEAYAAIYGRRDAGNEELSVAYRRLIRLRILTAVPLLCWLRTLPFELFGSAEHVRAVRAVESYVVRRMLTGGQTRGYGNAFLNVLKAAQNAFESGRHGVGVAIADAVITELESGPASLAWPSDEDVELAFRHRQPYIELTQERVRMVLGAIDDRLQQENRNTESATFRYDNLQIEHIMPQAWEKYWPLPTPGEDAAPDISATSVSGGALTLAQRNTQAKLQRIAVLHRWGNLTLVTSTFNRSVSNLGWDKKQPEFAGQSKLELNKPVAAQEVWDEDAIDQRGDVLAAAACRVWRRH